MEELGLLEVAGVADAFDVCLPALHILANTVLGDLPLEQNWPPARARRVVVSESVLIFEDASVGVKNMHRRPHQLLPPQKIGCRQ
jgi:hypothetical protein